MLFVDHNNDIYFELNKTDFTAQVIPSPDAKGDIFIPRSLYKNNQEYIIKRILNGSFKYKKIQSIRFDENSEVEYIEKEAFKSSTIQFVQIPKKVKKIESCCFNACYQLKTV